MQAKHLRWARALLAEAVRAAVADAGQTLASVGYVCVCTSTGYLLPGLSAYVLMDLGLPRTTARLDIVGMGCHAGLNALQVVPLHLSLHRATAHLALASRARSARAHT